ncbi:hypothetical protein Bca52824_000168 [Brassica carinata]|uniref:Uncharacterized protein n=1 Tax=Brassica carinata TaxID=52824 RepID=A0A8X8BC27_BRACI|nr:hypothetical protein Bca52824_000168 [Brassica carinata]
MLRDIAWWEVDSTFTPSFHYRGKYKINFMVILRPIEEESEFRYNVRLVVPHDDKPPSPKLLDTTISFEWLYKSLLQTGTVQDPKPMTMTREVVPLCLLGPPPTLSRCYDPAYINLYVRRWMSFGEEEFSIIAYVVDTETSFPDGWIDAFTRLGITIIPQRADTHARAHRMSVDIVLWAIDHPATYFQPRDLLVFSDNVKVGKDFYNALEALGDRYYNVCVLPPPDLNVSMPHQIFSNHMPRISREEAIGFSSGLASLYNQDFDICPTDISIILLVLREIGYHGRMLFRTYLPYQGDEPLLGYRDDGYARVPSIKV